MIKGSDMFKFVGAEAVEGAVKKAGSLLQGIDASSINEWVNSKAEDIPILGIFLKGYNSMTDEEQAAFAKNLMLAGAALAAKRMGGMK